MFNEIPPLLVTDSAKKPHQGAPFT